MFGSRPAVTAGRRLYLHAVDQARQPVFYAEWGVPDTADGRFELYSLHVILLLHRLKSAGEASAEVAQGLFDAYVKSLDDAIREAGVGDLSVGKKVRKLGEAFMGRLKAYDSALAALPSRDDLGAVITRTVYDGDAGRSPELTDYAARCAARLAQEPASTFLDGRAVWAEAR